MYLFYFDESGSRDPSVGTKEVPKDHIYVLLAVGMYEGQWSGFDREISDAKRRLIRYRHKDNGEPFDLVDCEVKSNWIRRPNKTSQFFSVLRPDEREKLISVYYEQFEIRKTVVCASVIDKRYLYEYMNGEQLHKKDYEFLLERIQHYMRQYQRKHNALIVMDDTGKNLNRAVASKHAWFQREGNRNMRFRKIVEYPFFVSSELSNGIQLADILAYNIYRAFKSEDMDYEYFRLMLPRIYRQEGGENLDGLKIWPEKSPLIEMWEHHRKTLPREE